MNLPVSKVEMSTPEESVLARNEDISPSFVSAFPLAIAPPLAVAIASSNVLRTTLGNQNRA
jgi:hypothetical protein